MTDEAPLALFDLPPLPAEPEPEPKPPPAPKVRAPRGPVMTRPRNVAKLECVDGCGWKTKGPMSTVLDELDELSRCPGCRKPAGVKVVGLVSR